MNGSGCSLCSSPRTIGRPDSLERQGAFRQNHVLENTLQGDCNRASPCDLGCCSSTSMSDYGLNNVWARIVTRLWQPPKSSVKIRVVPPDSSSVYDEHLDMIYYYLLHAPLLHFQLSGRLVLAELPGRNFFLKHLIELGE